VVDWGRDSFRTSRCSESVDSEAYIEVPISNRRITPEILTDGRSAGGQGSRARMLVVSKMQCANGVPELPALDGRRIAQETISRSISDRQVKLPYLRACAPGSNQADTKSVIDGNKVVNSPSSGPTPSPRKGKDSPALWFAFGQGCFGCRSSSKLIPMKARQATPKYDAR
jgi:hypothetical protein